MKDVVIGVAGHVDHGKTALVQALTGKNTDSMKEEQDRGLTINIGFAHLDYKGQQFGLVDVPGHEKFIKNMVAGLPGLGLVLIVIDVNEGIMPQTEEHLNILHLLGVDNYIVVLSKVSKADPEIVEIVKEEIQLFIEETGLLSKDAPIVETDALDHIGIDELKETIYQMMNQEDEAKEFGQARMNIDRVFSVKGHGTIVTGTLVDGFLQEGDEMVIYPQELETRVRNIQIFDQDQNRADPGHRVALNIANVKVEDIERGDVITTKDNVVASYMLDVKVKCLPNAAPIDHWTRVRLLIGTQEVIGRIVPLATEAIQPGEEAYAQLRLESECVAKKGDRFILRSYSPMTTIGGGFVLEAEPKKHKKSDTSVVASLQIKEESDPEDLLLDFFNQSDDLYFTKDALGKSVEGLGDNLDQTLEDLIAQNKITNLGKAYASTQKLDDLEENVNAELSAYHQDFPLRPGLAKSELRSRISQKLGYKESSLALDYLQEEGRLKEVNDFYAHKDFEIRLSPSQEEKKKELKKILEGQRFNPLVAKDLAEDLGESTDFLHLVEGDLLVFLDKDYLLSKGFYDEAMALVTTLVEEKGQMELADFRDKTDSSRKNSLLILEHFDRVKFTRRVGDARVLWKKK